MTDASPEIIDIPVLIVGTGPVGLNLSLELSRYGCGHMLVGEEMTTARHPRANAIGARSMEHYRRLGLADVIRQQGLPLDHPWDIVYLTRLNGREIARRRVPSRGEVLAAREHGDSLGWPTPEHPHRLSQIYLEKILYDAAVASECAQIRLGSRVTTITEHPDHVEALVVDLETGRETTVRARWLVGCDGARSTVREAIGVRFEGERSKRVYYGGSTLAVFFESTDLQGILADRRAQLYQLFNTELRAGGFSINGTDRFVFHFQAPEGVDPQTMDERPLLRTIVGCDLEYNLLSRVVWSAGLALVVEKQSTDRIFLAGDAAHLFTPTGGFGMNTGLDEAANLAWKLAAMEAGWGGPHLLATYDSERRPVAVRNVKAAAAIADVLVTVKVDPAIEEDSEAGAHARAETQEKICAALNREVNTKGVQLGVRYEGSAIVLADGTPPTPDDPVEYVPTARPGSRLPHVMLSDGPIFDKLGAGFTLLCVNAPASEQTSPSARSEPSVPLSVVRVDHPDLDQFYGARYVLVRPDQHVAWRGNEVPSEFADILRTSAGGRVPAAVT